MDFNKIFISPLPHLSTLCDLFSAIPSVTVANFKYSIDNFCNLCKSSIKVNIFSSIHLMLET